MVAPELVAPSGISLLQDTPTTWIEVRVVSASRVHFYDSPSAPTPRKAYVVKGDGLGVLEAQSGWLRVEFQGRSMGWIKESDLYQLTPP